MAKGQNVEDFIVNLGFSDKEAVKGLQDFLKKVNKTRAVVKSRFQGSGTGRGGSSSRENKSELAFLSAKNQLQAKILAAEKQGINTSSYKQTLARATKLETLTRRRLELEKNILDVKPVNEKNKIKQKASDLVKKEKTDFSNKWDEAIHLNKKRDANAAAKYQMDLDEAIYRNKRKDEEAVAKRQKEIDQAIHMNRVRDIKIQKELELAKNKMVNGSLLRQYDFRRGSAESGTFKAKINNAKSTGELRDLNNEMQRNLHMHRKQQAELKKTNAAQRGLSDSTKHLIRSYVSVFAILGATNSINRVGQQFEAIDSAMLAAMGSTEEAAKQIAFLDTMTSRLGLSLADTADQYTKFIFASKGKMETEDVNFLFQSMAEMGTVLGISKDRMKLSFTAIQQMMNKGTISSEELKRQLAESMPSAIQVFAKAVGVSEAELFKLMETGQLMAADVLPKVAVEMAKVANNAGALEAKYKTTRVAQGRFFKELETANKNIFRGGFDEGFAALLNQLAESLAEAQPQLESFGEVFKTIFLVIKGVMTFVTPILKTIISVLGSIAKLLNLVLDTKIGTYIAGLGALAYGFVKLSGGIKLVAGSFVSANAAALSFSRTLNVILTRIAPLLLLVEEFTALFDDKTTGIFELGDKKGKQGLIRSGDTVAGSMANTLLQFSPVMIGKNLSDYYSRQNAAYESKVDVKANIYLEGSELNAKKVIDINNQSNMVQGRG